jgi:DNA-binding Xre family transcriptional regulator
MPIRMRIGELAKQQGLTIKALAEQAGVAYNTAHALYTGRATRIDLDTLDRMCGALHAAPGDLFIRHASPEHGEHGLERGEHYEPDRAAGLSDRQAARPG